MKVLLVVPGFPLDFRKIQGGVHSAVNNLLVGFSNAPVEVRVLSFNKELGAPFIKKQFSENVSIHYYRNWEIGLQIVSYLLHGAKTLRKEIQEFKPDLIHYEEGMAFLLMRVWGVYKVREVLTIHGIIFAEAKLKARFIDKCYWYLNGIIERILIPSNIIHLSNYSKGIFEQNGIRPLKYEIIPNSITDVFFKLPNKSTLDRRLLYIGVIDENKNLLYLLQCLNELKLRAVDYQLVVVGDFNSDTYKQIILEFIEVNQLGDRVKFTGWIGQKQVREQIQEADILVVSSKQESYPMVIAESMAAGKLVLASRVGGIPEMIDDKINGFLFSNDNTEHLIELLIQVNENPDLIRSIGEGARVKAAETFRTSVVANKTIAFYKRILLENN